jgi:tetratricopeptide (TPR) repeat protein
LETRLEAASAGHGTLVMLVGEPGIGKTALCKEFADLVAERGGLPLIGHCYPEGSANLPYQPFVEAFESYARQQDVATLRAQLGSGVDAVARLAPAVRERLKVELAAPENAADDRLRLLSGILEGLRNIGVAQPLLLVLEDLHDADRGTLDLLVYLARHLDGMPLLVVGTYRDVEVDRAHPVAAALAELRRVTEFERVHLGELSVDEVQRLLASNSQQVVPRPLAEAVHRRSGGNALFAHELLRFLLSERLIEERNGALRRVGDADLAGQMPEGLRDVVGKRLSRLSAAANQVLSAASVIGRDFQLDVLRRLDARPDEELEKALEEAVDAALVEERSVVGAAIMYRFSHAFFQQTLYDEIMAPRRIRLHQHIARALEEVHARRLDEHAAELAEHYAFSSDTKDLAKAVYHGELAAKRAIDVFAYGEAARQLERALAVQDLVDPDDKGRRCDLLLTLSEALFLAGETDRVITQCASDALTLAEGLGDRSRAFRACRLAMDGIFARGAGTTAAQPEYLTWAERATQYADPESIERSHADLALANVRYTRGQFRQARALRLEALALARHHADPEALFSAAWHLMANYGDPQHWDESVSLAKESAGWSRQGVSSQTLGYVLWISGRILLAQGERVQAEELWRQVQELAERTHVGTLSLFVLQRNAILAIIDGHLDEAAMLIRRSVERAVDSGVAVRARQFGVLMLNAPALYLGRPDVWLTAFDEYAWPASLEPRLGMPGIFAARATCLAYNGRVDEARTLVGPVLDEIALRTGDDLLPIGMLDLLLQAAVVLEHQTAARTLAAQLACVAHLAHSHTYTCIARHLGDAAALAGESRAARSYYAQALEAAAKIRFRPEVALAHLRLAELLLEEGHDAGLSEAMDHLDHAIPELRDMKMQPGLDRAQALSDTRRPAPPRVHSRSPRPIRLPRGS